MLCFTDPAYPALLRETSDPPLALLYRGELRVEDELAVAVVGSRRATAYGLELSRHLAGELARRGLTIVSGLARGIDAAAHRGALDAGGRSIAVLGSGLERLYPPEHRDLAERIAARGAVLSEFALDAPPLAAHFPRRNRVITGLTLGTLVVEAALKSGSLISARHALEQNREVFAVPGPVGSPNSEGVHALIRDGARLVGSAEEILEELRPDVRERLACVGPPSPPEPLDPRQKRLLELLQSNGRPLDADELVERSGLTTRETLEALLELEMKSRIASLPGGLYATRMA